MHGLLPSAFVLESIAVKEHSHVSDHGNDQDVTLLCERQRERNGRVRSRSKESILSKFTSPVRGDRPVTGEIQLSKLSLEPLRI
jgi:hypothetical protein